MHPDFQRGGPYGDRFDDEIIAALDEGVTGDVAAARIGIGRDFVVKRAREIGYDNAWARKSKPRKVLDPRRPLRRPSTPSKAKAAVVVERRCDGASKLARQLRRQIIVVDGDGLDPSHGLACLHAAGLTLPEIHDLTGFPAPAVIDAVRRHPEVRA